MTTKELRILAHTLGYRLEAKSWDLETHRNHYVATRGTASEEYFLSLIAQGYAEPLPRPLFISEENVVFRATPLGHHAVLREMGELSRKARIKIACARYP